MPVKILIVDDHEIVRQGIRSLLTRSRPEWEISGEATNGRDAIEAVRNLKPDVVILDVTMPVMSGLEAAQQIRKLGVATRILIFTMHESKRLAGEVREVGAHGVVLKVQAARDLIQAIDALLAGGTFFGGLEGSESKGEGKSSAASGPAIGAIFFRALAFHPSW
jgi:two-component system nitrate/nitrite response regulator NarL